MRLEFLPFLEHQKDPFFLVVLEDQLLHFCLDLPVSPLILGVQMVLCFLVVPAALGPLALLLVPVDLVDLVVRRVLAVLVAHKVPY